jgi:hypothetical protein
MNAVHSKLWEAEETKTTTDMMQIYDTRMNNLLSSVGNILKHSKKEDTTELPKFRRETRSDSTDACPVSRAVSSARADTGAYKVRCLEEGAVDKLLVGE